MSVDTDQQIAIYEAVANGSDDLIVVARAGTGKSTTIERAVTKVPANLSVLVLAFNKPVADAMKGRLRRFKNVDVRTCHSFGLKAIRLAHPDAEVDLDRAIKIARRLEVPRYELFAAANLAGRAKGQLIETTAEIIEYADSIGFDIPRGASSKFFRHTLNILDAAREWTGSVDYNDMSWLPVVDPEIEAAIPQHDLVFVDEVQDLNPVQIQLILKARKPEGRIVAVGDDRQSIYGFRGADRAAFESLKSHLRNPRTLPLSVSFRCPREVIRVAQREVPDIEPCGAAQDGIVRRATIEECLEGVEYGDFILSRTNAPLIQCAMRLITTDCRVAVLGRDIGRGLVGLVKKLNCKSAYELVDKVRVWAEKEVRRQLSYEPPRDRAADLALDRADCLIAIAETCQTIEEVTDRVEGLFPKLRENFDGRDCVTLSTTHQAKGLERERVWLLRSTYLIPRRGVISPEEHNLFYVGVTRAKHELVIVSGLPGSKRDA